jgi:hypothetical protein
MPVFDKTLRDTLTKISKSFPIRLIRRPQGRIQVPYLYRSYLSRKDSDEEAVFLHRFVSSDQKGEIHSHPWKWSVSFILAGRYRETRAKGRYRRHGKVHIGSKTVRVFFPGMMNIIEKDDFHRVEILDKEVWTLFIHGQRIQDWGFVPEKFNATNSIRVVKARTFSKKDAIVRTS